MHYLIFHKEDSKEVNLNNKVGFKGTEEECAKEFRERRLQASQMGSHQSGIDEKNRVWFKARKEDGSSIKVWLCDEKQASQLVF